MTGPTSRVLKHGSLEGHSPILRADEVLASATERARQIVAAAEDEASSVLGRGAAELQRARLAAFAEGHGEGMAAAAAALALAADVRQGKLAELDCAVVEVALEIARQLVGRELTTSPDVVVDMAKRALRAAAGTGDVVLRVAAEDMALVQEAGGALRTLVERGSLVIALDHTLQRGEVVVESIGGRVDARIAAQLESFQRALQAEGP